MGEAMDRESNSATQDPLRDAGAPPSLLDGRPDIRTAYRLRGWVIAVGASLVLWGGIVAVVWLVSTALT